MTETAPALSAPAAGRNREPILRVLRRVLPATGTVLEVASGSGEHALWFSAALPHLLWQPTDRDPVALGSIAAWRAGSSPNLLAPLPLDAAAPDWPVTAADAMLAINMVHIAPWAATAGLFAGAARLLPPGGLLVLYGPYREAEVPLAPSNAAFDAELRRRDPEWGLRDRERVETLAGAHGLHLAERVSMPANNLLLVFHRA